MKVVQVCAEFAPVAKAGGMGEAIFGLTRELVRSQESVEVFIPKYSLINSKKLTDLSLETADFRSSERGRLISNSIWTASIEGCLVRLIECHHPSGYFHRDKIYGYPDDAARFLYFCRVVMSYLQSTGKAIDILHLHDWHSAPCAVLAREMQLKVGHSPHST